MYWPIVTSCTNRLTLLLSFLHLYHSFLLNTSIIFYPMLPFSRLSLCFYIFCSHVCTFFPFSAPAVFFLFFLPSFTTFTPLLSFYHLSRLLLFLLFLPSSSFLLSSNLLPFYSIPFLPLAPFFLLFLLPLPPHHIF